MPLTDTEVRKARPSVNDWLGTKRGQFSSGTVASPGVKQTSWQSDPFGDYMTPHGSGGDANEMHLTGKEHDSESGNDYFGARYYNSPMGRFMSPDWSAKAEPVPYAKLGNPQTLNLYAFVGNSPVSHVDVDGHAPLGWGGFEDCHERGDCNGGGQTQAQQVFNMITRDLDDGATVNFDSQLSDSSAKANVSLLLSATKGNSFDLYPNVTIQKSS
jgi:RHS repeat-associated protein